jgi:hypothetical protein
LLHIIRHMLQKVNKDFNWSDCCTSKFMCIREWGVFVEHKGIMGREIFCLCNGYFVAWRRYIISVCNYGEVTETR